MNIKKKIEDIKTRYKDRMIEKKIIKNILSLESQFFAVNSGHNDFTKYSKFLEALCRRIEVLQRENIEVPVRVTNLINHYSKKVSECVGR